MKNNRCGPPRRSGNPLRVFLSRGDPPIIGIIGGGPPRRILARGDPPNVRNLIFIAEIKFMKYKMLSNRNFSKWELYALMY